jgi:hypothetical protein
MAGGGLRSQVSGRIQNYKDLHNKLQWSGPDTVSGGAQSAQWLVRCRMLPTTAYTPALGPTQPPVQWVLRVLSPREKLPGFEAEQPPPSLMPRLRIRGALHPLPHTSSRRDGRNEFKLPLMSACFFSCVPQFLLLWRPCKKVKQRMLSTKHTGRSKTFIQHFGWETWWRSVNRWDDRIKINRKEKYCKDVKWIR